MAQKKSFQERYQENDTPWETHRADYNLTQTVACGQIIPGRALDIGCGSGNNVIWLAQNGFEAAGCDLAPTALKQARQKARDAGVSCDFFEVNFLENEIPGSPFDLLFDRGCFHTMADPQQRRLFSKRAAALLKPAGIWLSLSGNADEDREGEGPPQLSAQDICLAVEDDFEIISLASCRFDSDMEPPPRGWLCQMRRRL